MKRTILNVTVGIAAFAGGCIVGSGFLPSVHAEQTAYIQKSWGHCVGGSGQTLIFEGADGTVRVLNNGSLFVTYIRQ